MLIKLFKYDLKYLMKSVVVFYLFSIISAIIYAVVSSLKNNFVIFEIIQPIFAALLFIILAGTILYTFYLSIKRFYQNTLKDEGYLTNTLPVKKSTIVLARLLSSTLSMICTGIVCFVIMLVLDYETFNLANLSDEIMPGLNGYTFLTIFSIVLITQYMSYTTSFYNALSLGNKHNNNKIVWSIIYGVAIYLCIQVISIVFILLYTLLYYPNISSMDFAVYLSENDMAQISLIMQILGAATFLNIFYTLVNCLMTSANLKNKLNLE